MSAETYLRNILRPGDTVYALRMGRTGKSTRAVSLFAVDDCRPVNIDAAVSSVTSLKLSPHGGLVIRGTGFSASQHAVEQLSYALFGKAGTLKYSDM